MLPEFRQILGVRFYIGDMGGLLERTKAGGLIVVPSAPVLVDLAADPAHKEALENADFAITDSGFLVMLWAVRKFERIPRVSGLRFLRALLGMTEFRQSGATFWVMPSVEDDRANQEWLREQGLPVDPDDCYVAPIYPSGRLDDSALLAQLESKRPRFVILNIRGGVQERLGYSLISRLSYRPAVLCTGGAIAFLSGRQVHIPVWADRLILGWLFRSLSHPLTFPPRLWKALGLAPMVFRFTSAAVPLDRRPP